MKFTKMQGIGNDYIYLNCFTQTVSNPSELAVQMSNRHFGVGGDGLVLIMPSEVANARMRMFNADGSEAEMCGNAIRCVGKYLFEHQLVRQPEMSIETLAGIKQLKLIISNSQVSSVQVNMGAPIITSDLIPITGPARQVINEPISAGNHSYQFTAVSMGNPHCVIFVPEITDEIVLNDGPLLEKHTYFPRRINVEFVKINNRHSLTMRVWERGSGETMACGTGACAAVVAAILNGLTDRQAEVELLGGQLEIKWEEATNQVLMTGQAMEVFEGEWLL